MTSLVMNVDSPGAFHLSDEEPAEFDGMLDRSSHQPRLQEER
jgi:hypothetical protein